jgi:hypothetical protein
VRLHVVLRGDERDLLRKEEMRARTVPPEERRIAAPADDGPRDRCDRAWPMTDQTLAKPRPVPRATVTRPRWPLSRGAHRAVLTVHIVASVGLLGDCAALLATAVRAATTDDPAVATTSYELMSMFSMLFGIPLSLASLATGLALGFGTKWGVLRFAWVTAKLLLIVSVILVGALIIGPSEAAMVDGEGGRELVIPLAAGYDVIALWAATGLSVYKPRRRTRR